MRRIVIFLNGTRGISILEKLKESIHDILTCIIPIEKEFDEVEKQIKKIGFRILRIHNVNHKTSIKILKKYNPKLFIIAGYSTIFKKELMNLPEWGTVNLHAGPLPEYRGGSPLNWQIINGEKKVSVSIIKVDEGIDTGEILKEKDILINSDIDIGTLHDKVNKLFPKLVTELLDSLEKNKNFKGRSQNNKKAVYWHQRNDDDGYLDFKKMHAKQVSRFVKALTHPYPGAWAWLNKNKVRILKVELPKFDLRGVSSRICYLKNVGPYIICKDKAILVKKYLIENKNNIKLKNGQYLT